MSTDASCAAGPPPACQFSVATIVADRAADGSACRDPGASENAYHLLARLSRAAPAVLPAAASWAERVKRHREKLRISQMVAAEQIGISRAYLAQVERGREPAPALAAKLERWLAGSG
jgi:DNA-binding XRE family transcriptional regulator